MEAALMPDPIKAGDEHEHTTAILRVAEAFRTEHDVTRLRDALGVISNLARCQIVNKKH